MQQVRMLSSIRPVGGDEEELKKMHQTGPRSRAEIREDVTRMTPRNTEKR